MTELDREFNAGLAVINRAMQEAKEKANAEYQGVVGKARRARMHAYAKAEKEAERARADLLGGLAERAQAEQTEQAKAEEAAA